MFNEFQLHKKIFVYVIKIQFIIKISEGISSWTYIIDKLMSYLLTVLLFNNFENYLLLYSDFIIYVCKYVFVLFLAFIISECLGDVEKLLQVSL